VFRTEHFHFFAYIHSLLPLDNYLLFFGMTQLILLMSFLRPTICMPKGAVDWVIRKRKVSTMHSDTRSLFFVAEMGICSRLRQ
jgi:hypothetical protein